MKKEDKYINFFGDTQNYQFDKPIPNPYNLRGNPDEFDWGMNQGGDGLNGQPPHNITPYASFDGEGIDEGYYEDEFANHPGFISGFLKRNPDRIVTIPSSSGQPDLEIPYSELQANPELLASYKDYKSASRKQWWGNFWDKLGSATATLPDKFTSGVQAGSGIYQPTQVVQPIQPIAPVINPPAQAGMGTGKIIGWVLVGGVVITALIMAMNMGKETQPAPIIIAK